MPGSVVGQFSAQGFSSLDVIAIRAEAEIGPNGISGMACAMFTFAVADGVSIFTPDYDVSGDGINDALTAAVEFVAVPAKVVGAAP